MRVIRGGCYHNYVFELLGKFGFLRPSRRVNNAAGRRGMRELSFRLVLEETR